MAERGQVRFRSWSLGEIYKKYLLGESWPLVFIRPVEVFLLQKCLPNLKRPVVDYGCGDGFLAEACFEEKLDWGVDPDRRALNQAEGRKVYFQTGAVDGRRLPFEDKTFQTIFTNCVLEHIIDLEEVLTEFNRVLKPGGRVVATVMTRQINQYLFLPRLFKGSSLARRYLAFFHRISNHHQFLTATQWEERFRAAGFKKEIGQGYLANWRLMILFDLSHWLAAPQLLIKKIFGKVIIITPFRMVALSLFARLKPEQIFREKETQINSPYCLFVLRKNEEKA